jgi:hypothetical protein
MSVPSGRLRYFIKRGANPSWKRREKMKYTLKDYNIFWDNGHYVAVRTGLDGVRRNIAPIGCKTKREAIDAAKEDRDDLNERACLK